MFALFLAWLFLLLLLVSFWCLSCGCLLICSSCYCVLAFQILVEMPVPSDAKAGLPAGSTEAPAQTQGTRLCSRVMRVRRVQSFSSILPALLRLRGVQSR